MGVIGSVCQLCGLPLQHDHYVPSDGMLKIYRGSDAGGAHDWEPGERVVAFGSEHAWLADAVAITDDRVLAGTVEDGVLASGDESVFIAEGLDEGLGFHRYCWLVMGMPTSRETAALGSGTFAYARAEIYQGQLFELQELIDHGKAWMLVDPREDGALAQRSRDRISALIDDARRPIASTRPRRVTDVLAADRDWRGAMRRGDEHEPRQAVHYRATLHPELEDIAEYPHRVRAIRRYGLPGMPASELCDELDAFEERLKQAVEANARAILLITTIGEGAARFLVHARDEAETCAAIRALHSEIDFDNETDPTWRAYFRETPRRE